MRGKGIATAAVGLWVSLGALSAQARMGSTWFNMSQVLTGNNFFRGGYGGQTAPRICVPQTCESQGKNCGTISDTCGHTIDCGSCSGFETCGEGGTPNVCGQTCYHYAYFSNPGNVENLYTADTCGGSTQNLTHATAPGHDYSNLSISSTLDSLSYFETDTAEGGAVSEYLSTVNSSGGGWNNITDAPAKPQMIAWGPGALIAYASRQADGHDVIRINNNWSGGYPASDSATVADLIGLVATSLTWIPTSDSSWSHRLVVAAAPSRSATAVTRFDNPSNLYVIQVSDDYRTGRLIPLESTSAGSDVPPVSMEGDQPAPSRRGQRLLFVKKDLRDRQRIYECDFDFRELDLHSTGGRAYCPSPVEMITTRDSDGDLASPCWSYDNNWIFYLWKAPASPGALPSHWNIYRDKYIGTFFRQGLSTDPTVDQTDIVCFPRLIEAVINTGYSAAALQPAQTYQAAPPPPVQVLPLIRCDTDANCPSDRVCRDHACVHR